MSITVLELNLDARLHIAHEREAQMTAGEKVRLQVLNEQRVWAYIRRKWGNWLLIALCVGLAGLGTDKEVAHWLVAGLMTAVPIGKFGGDAPITLDEGCHIWCDCVATIIRERAPNDGHPFRPAA